MAHYKNVTQEEIEPFLFIRGFQKMNLPGTFELVYGKLMRHNEIVISLRIYTGIGLDGQSRAPGKDAIRLTLWIKDQFGKPKLIGAQRRVHRVYGWRKNLEQRIESWQELIGPFCPRCGSLMVLRAARKNKKNKFWGCVKYPSCYGVKNIVKEQEELEDHE